MASPASPRADVQKNAESDSTPAQQPFPPPKTDKPRPHVCTTCTRSFARLEHLKRHERSHTKEKPFECEQCGRCFARRDLLLRHQQKLHQTGNPSKPRTARRESTSGVPPSRARKSSIAGAAPFAANQMPRAAMRPRANTISHIDGNALNMIVNQHNRQQALPPFVHQPISPMPNFSGFDFGQVAGFGHVHATQSLSKIETSGLGLDIGGGLKTAPLARFTEENRLFSTVNPAQLHFGVQTGTPDSPFTQSFPPFVPNGQTESHVDWLNSANDAMVSGVQESVMDGSSPSAISTGSQSGFSEVMIDGSNQAMHTTDWDNSMMLSSTHFSQETIPVFSELMQNPSMVPGDLHDPNTQQFMSFTAGTTSSMNTLASATAFPGQFLPSTLEFSSDEVSFRSPFIRGNGESGSVSAFGITDSVRQALLFSLSRQTPFGHTSGHTSRYPQSGMVAPIAGSDSISVSLPSTADLQRFVNSYIQFFHPHLPFLHIPTLSFDSPVFTSQSRNHSGDSRGAGCLILAMAAIGASFEFEQAAAQEVSEAAKKLMSLYLEERRMSIPVNGSKTQQETPLWLVQAMLLNLIYGHQCGDQKAAEIASTHIAALVSLAKSASLEKSNVDLNLEQKAFEIWSSHNRLSDGDGTPTSIWDESMTLERASFSHWYRWKLNEERKRTLFSVFILSSFLLIAYNAQPMVLNSELHLELPCEEDLWGAKSPLAWNKLGGTNAVQNNSITFAGALTFLLSASKRNSSQNLMSPGHMSSGSSLTLEQLPKSQLAPSTFGCFILINALHVFIWETRQRYQDREWSAQETQQLYSQLAPALQEWQSAWASNPHHHLEQSHSSRQLADDSVPLLDLAFIRLCVNLGPSKEAFWSRDFEAMAQEFPSRSQQVEFAPKLSDDLGQMHLSDDLKSEDPSLQIPQPERNLRKAACYAADSLRMSDKLGLTFAQFTSRELPIQNAMCNFDCTQVLAEWLATVQDRVGLYLGIIGSEMTDLHSSSAAAMLLDEDDHRLIAQIAEIISNAEAKIDPSILNQEHLQTMGYTSRLPVVMALMLDRAAVWGVTDVMATCLRTLATVLDERAKRSLVPSGLSG